MDALGVFKSLKVYTRRYVSHSASAYLRLYDVDFKHFIVLVCVIPGNKCMPKILYRVDGNLNWWNIYVEHRSVELNR